MRASDSESSVTGLETPCTLLVDHLLATSPGAIYLVGCGAEDLSWPQDRDEPHMVHRFDTLESAIQGLKVTAPADSSAQIAVLNIGSDEAGFAQKIGQAIRAFPNRLIVYTSAVAVPDTLFFAFGFRKLNVIKNTSDSGENKWYEYRLSHYKQSPDWLNARFWANPERFKLDDDPDVYFDPDDSDEEE